MEGGGGGVPFIATIKYTEGRLAERTKAGKDFKVLKMPGYKIA